MQETTEEALHLLVVGVVVAGGEHLKQSRIERRVWEPYRLQHFTVPATV